jgi:hypothetical protein
VTLYQKGWLFIAWVMFLFIMAPVWFFGAAERWGTPGMLIAMAFWLSQGALSLWLFKCPKCGCSIFASGKGFFAIHAPWPRRRCGECGHDHTV